MRGNGALRLRLFQFPASIDTLPVSMSSLSMGWRIGRSASCGPSGACESKSTAS